MSLKHIFYFHLKFWIIIIAWYMFTTFNLNFFMCSFVCTFGTKVVSRFWDTSDSFKVLEIQYGGSNIADESTICAQNYKELGIYKVADQESFVKVWNFKMANPRSRTNISIHESVRMKLDNLVISWSLIIKHTSKTDNSKWSVPEKNVNF